MYINLSLNLQIKNEYVVTKNNLLKELIKRAYF